MIDVLGGTPEAAWRADDRLADLPPLDWGAPPGRVVVVSPHPDDEVLGAGGTMRLLAGRGFDVELVAVTDGEGSHPGSTAVSPAELAARRPAETAEAFARLGVRLLAQHRLQIPDGGIAARVDELAQRLAPIVEKAVWVLGIWRHDGHPDHEAVGAAVAATGARLAEYPVWLWNWAAPGEDATVPWAQARRVDLDPVTRAAKAAAIAAHTSQLQRHGPAPEDGPILPEPVLAHFRRPYEVLFT